MCYYMDAEGPVRNTVFIGYQTKNPRKSRCVGSLLDFLYISLP
jgi:hypothetical protein